MFDYQLFIIKLHYYKKLKNLEKYQKWQRTLNLLVPGGKIWRN